MSQRSRSPARGKRRTHAPVFAALGNRTRLTLVGRLSGGEPCSISQLTAASRLTRQAITKHLRVLEQAGIVHGVRRGRESLFAFNPAPLDEARGYLDALSQQWDQTLMRLKNFVEEEPEFQRRNGAKS
jgi:DNA-binding transcriptional ArsR family regulator